MGISFTVGFISALFVAKKPTPHINVHINNLIGEATINSKEDADNFMEKLSESLQRVTNDVQFASEPVPDQAQEN